MTRAFDHILSLLSTVPDPRRAEGKRYSLPHILLFSILAVVTGANSYRGIRTFMAVHHDRLNEAFGLNWKKPPAHTQIRSILTGLEAEDVERAFRNHAEELDAAGAPASGMRALALDGKALRGSFDAIHDVRARQIMSVFAADTLLVLAHVEIDEKSNEIPAAVRLLEELDVADRIVTLDAMHCQKKLSRPRPPRTPT
ncbi:MAG: ISAs1 family transposase [Alphaproteobacteria bacterium]|nr:ISAs1 family transposase [Alphaproteobacteria bacterium]